MVLICLCFVFLFFLTATTKTVTNKFINLQAKVLVLKIKQNNGHYRYNQAQQCMGIFDFFRTFNFITTEILIDNIIQKYKIALEI